MTRACILGLSGTKLKDKERDFLRDAQPWAVILFKRNVTTPQATAALVADVREALGREALVFVDQEGGRVQRLGPPHWPVRPPAARIAALYARAPEEGLTAARLHHRLLAEDLRKIGASAACAPVLDVPQPGADAIIGDRAFGDHPDPIAALGRAALDGLAEGGVAGVIKHIPGHGRAGVDSHKALPRVDATRADLEAVDFAPFRALADAPMAMTAHVVFEAVDADQPATLSRAVVHDVIRDWIGFDGLLMSDDLDMRALKGPMRKRCDQAFAAGCDVVLQCDGDFKAMKTVAEACPELTGDALRRAQAADAAATGAVPNDDPADVERAYEALMNRAIATA